MTVGLLHGDCLEVLPTLAAASVDLVLTDPPYYKVKKDAWDRQWKTPEDYLTWLRRVLVEFRRVLKPNGSLYLFASPQMSARVECCVGEVFDVLNSVVWNKLSDYEAGDRRATAYKAREHESFRKFFDYSERIIFAEQKGSDCFAKGEAQYVAKCDELRGFVFEPLRKHLDDAREQAGYDRKQCDRHLGNQMSGHYFSTVQWALPTSKNYAKLQELFGTERLPRRYEDLRRQYEDLRRQYEDLRRPFNVTADVPYTDVWDFQTVPHYKGKHPCEKPAALVEHMITASSRPGAVVLDAFMGSGVVGEVALKLTRNFIGIEADAAWHSKASTRVGKAKP
jgi:site-specific DNA-methyltransferase (adenine-specific)